MPKFRKELLIGIAIILVGLSIAVNSEQYIFFGLVVVGIFFVVLAFMHLYQSKSGVGSVRKMYPPDGVGTVRKMWPTNKPKEKASFLQNLESQENLDVAKQVSITCSRKDQSGSVFLNGVQVGTVEPDNPLVFIVTKKNNVVNISEHYEGICFFHVTDANGIGTLKIGVGMEAASIKIARDTGLTEGIKYDSQDTGFIETPVIKRRRKRTAIILAAIPYTGIFGIDRFYLGYIGMGILKFCTAGACGVLWIVDLVRIANGSMKDKRGNPLI
ncbi:MAG: TM2 domain-containing protein [Coriobacteriales bacterium]|jgi:hypothetical protein|nr:TM2 domain-containing protein [Coriobacteriales bacterium]